MRNYSWSMQTSRSKSVETPSAIGERYLRTLDALSRIDPVLNGWVIWEGKATLDDLLAWASAGSQEPAPIKAVPLEHARRGMTGLVETSVQLNDWGEEQPDEGYNLVASNKYNGSPRNVDVSVTAGSEFDQNWWSVNFGERGPGVIDPSLLTYPIMDGIFRTMTANWPTPWARLQGVVVEYEDNPGIVGRTSVVTFRHDITWMGYLSAALAPGFTPPADLISERTANGGILMLTGEERPDPANTDQMRRSDLLTTIMDKYFPDT